jgi:hypothetical protein
VAPSERIQADRAGSVQDHEAAKTMGGPVVAAGAPVRTDAVVNFEGTALYDDAHSEAVTDTDTSHVGASVGFSERHHRIGYVLRRKGEGRGAGRSRQVTCGTHGR